MLSTGAGATIGAWKNHQPESTRPGHFTFCSACESSVSHEVLAPFWVARRLRIFNRLDTAGRARGLSGAPDGARGRRPSPEDLHRLDPDGWLGQSTADSNTTESPASRKGQPVTTGRVQMAVESAESCCAPSSRSHSRDDETRSESRTSFTGPSHPGLDTACLLDTRLLMGGTDADVKIVGPCAANYIKTNSFISNQLWTFDSPGSTFCW